MESTGHRSERWSQTAAQQVLATPELLEIILSQLRFCDLLVSAQRVNRTFNGVISRSQPIQRTLFFLPDPDQINSRPCPILRGSSRTRFIDKRIDGWTETQRDLEKQGEIEFVNEWADDAGIQPYNRYTTSSTRRAAMARDEASWRRMLIIQPPIKEVHIDSAGEWVDSDDWLCMGTLAKSVVTCRHIAVDRDGVGYFRIQLFSRG